MGGSLLMSFSRAQQLDSSDPDVKAIVDVARDFSRAIEAGDLDRVVSFYSRDIVKTAPGRPPQRGWDGVREAWKATLLRYDCHLEVHVDEVKVLGTVGYDSGKFVMTLKPKGGGETIRATGRVFEVVRKEDGAWKSLRVISMNEE